MSLNTKSYDIRQRSIVTAQRLELTSEYNRIHYGLDGYRIEPRIIVVHYTAFESLEKSYNFMAPDELSGIRQDIKSGGALNVGTHYLIDRNGDIVQLIDEDVMARHTIGFNHVALSLENVGRGQDDLTQDQVEADAWLIDLLVRRHPTIEYLIGHYEYMDSQKPHYQLLAERDPSYSFTIKQDPGGLFMKRLREMLAGEYGISLKD